MTTSLALPRSNPALAQIGNTHGYRFDGDLAHLNADIFCNESALGDQEWALQLWANKQIKIAELFIGKLHPNGSGLICVSGTTSLLPPAGDGEYALTLALVSGTAEQFEHLEDCASFAQPVSFVQPRLRGDVTAEFSDDAIMLKLASIENPRPADNLSGTLALEVWALDEAYLGGLWSGQPLASVVLGNLDGQNAWADCSFISHSAPLPATGHLTLMLREWTPAGYVTRDYRTLPAGEKNNPAALAAETKTLVSEPQKITSKVAKPKKPATKSAKTITKAAVSPSMSAPASPATAHKPGSISVNKGSEAELAATKGLNARLAAAIIAARPFTSLEELTAVKGIGQKLLAKLVGKLRL